MFGNASDRCVGIHLVDVNGEYCVYIQIYPASKEDLNKKILNSLLNETSERSFQTQIGTFTSDVLTNYCKNQHTSHA
jgi:hypothetical protein